MEITHQLDRLFMIIVKKIHWTERKKLMLLVTNIRYGHIRIYHIICLNSIYSIWYYIIIFFGYFVIFMSKGILLVFSLIWHNQILNINKSMLFIFTRRMFVSFDSNFDMHHSTDILVVCNVSLTCFPESKRVFIKRD